MAVKLTEPPIVVSTTGIKTPAVLTKYPEGGATFSARVTPGGSATVRLRAWVESGAKETLATFVLPCTQPGKVGDLYDSLPVFSVWDGYDWSVDAISGTVTLGTVGVGI